MELGKAKWHATEVDYLSYCISPRKISMDIYLVWVIPPLDPCPTPRLTATCKSRPRALRISPLISSFPASSLKSRRWYQISNQADREDIVYKLSS